MNVIDNTNLKQMNSGLGTIGFVPDVTYEYDALAATVTVTNASTLQAGDSVKAFKARVHDFFGGEVRGAIIVGAGGTGYQSAPTVVFGGSGTGATGTATIADGKVTGVTITAPGTGYVDGDPVSFTGGGGYGAEGTLLETTGAVDSVTLTAPVANEDTIDISTLDRSKQLALSVTILTVDGIAADGGAYGLLAAGDVGHWDVQLNAQ